jgi:hypothetical protein
MQTKTIEFQASIQNGIVHIPKKYNYLQQQKQANFVVSYGYAEQKTDLEDKKQKMQAISIDTKKYKFDREEANAR